MQWGSNWAWSVPLILLSVMIHVFGIVVIARQLERLSAYFEPSGRSNIKFALIVSAATLSVTTLHGLEAFVWAVAYRLLDALPTQREAMLFSLEAMTAYGHEAFFLGKEWQMLGAIEALNGLLMLGLTTAFLFTVMQKIWSDATFARSAAAPAKTVPERLGPARGQTE